MKEPSSAPAPGTPSKARRKAGTTGVDRMVGKKSGRALLRDEGVCFTAQDNLQSAYNKKLY